MADFLEKHWDLINWPTALIAVVLLTPIVLILFRLVASHARNEAKAAYEARNQAHAARDAMQAERDAAREEANSLRPQAPDSDSRESWQDVELNYEEQLVLMALSEDRMSALLSSNEISRPRMSLARDRLIRAGLAAWGMEGAYATTEGREWLDAHDLLH